MTTKISLLIKINFRLFNNVYVLLCDQFAIYISIRLSGQKIRVKIMAKKKSMCLFLMIAKTESNLSNDRTGTTTSHDHRNVTGHPNPIKYRLYTETRVCTVVETIVFGYGLALPVVHCTACATDPDRFTRGDHAVFETSDTLFAYYI